MASPFLGNLKNTWAPLANAAIFLSGLVIVFVSAPARLWHDAPPSNALRFTQFVLALVLGLLVYASRNRPPTPKTRRLWLASVAITMLLGITLYFSYQAFSDSWTCEYDQHGPVVIGVTYTPDTAKWLEKNPMADCKRLLAAFAGNTPEIWQRDELLKRHFILTLLFSATVLLLSVAAVSVVQLVR
jgi:hypothetical protein